MGMSHENDGMHESSAVRLPVQTSSEPHPPHGIYIKVVHDMKFSLQLFCELLCCVSPSWPILIHCVEALTRALLKKGFVSGAYTLY